MSRTGPPSLFARACAVVAVLLLVAPATAAKMQRVGVLPTLGTALPAEDLAVVDDELKNGLVALGGFEVVDARAMGQQLASARELGLDCKRREPDCLAQLGVLAGLDLLVAAHAAPGEDGLDIDVTVVDVKATRALGGAKARVPPRGPDTRVGVKEALSAVLRPPTDGTLHVEVDVKGAVVYLNGAEQGRSPIAPRTGLAPGTYTIAAEADGYARRDAVAEVKAGEVTRVVLALATAPTTPSPPSPTEPPEPAADPGAAAAAAPTATPDAAQLMFLGGGALLAAAAIPAVVFGTWALVDTSTLFFAEETDARRAAGSRLGCFWRPVLRDERIKGDADLEQKACIPTVSTSLVGLGVSAAVAVLAAGVAGAGYALSE